MSLLTVVVLVIAFIAAAALIALIDKFLRPKLNYPGWIIQVGYGLIVLVLVLFLARAFGLWDLLRSVHT